MNGPTACTNCDASVDASDRFCRHCGQKVLLPEHRRFGALLGQVFEELTSINGRFLPTFARLVFRPGSLSLAYRRGQWRRYLAPINVFLLANLAFFLAPSLTDYSLTLSDQRELQPYSAAITPWIEAREAASELSPEAFADEYQKRVSDVAKTMVILHVPLIALGTMLIFFDRRLLFADHVVAAMHFFAFLMVYLAAMPLTIEPLIVALNDMLGGELPAFSISLALPLIYIPFMLAKAFEVGWLRALLSSTGFWLCYAGAHMVYRFVQLVVVLALM